jgi:tetratricopeptide (TPR) repeat protein
MAFQTAWYAHVYAKALEAAGLSDEANRMFEQATLEAARVGEYPSHALWLERLSVIHATNGELAIAEKMLRAAVEIERRERPATHPRLADRLSSLAHNLLKQQKKEEANALLTESLAIRQKSLPSDDLRIEDNIRVLRDLSLP